MPRCTKCGRWRPFSFQLNNGLCSNCFADAYEAKANKPAPFPPTPVALPDREPPIPEFEKRFYQTDDYYTEKDLAGNKVVPFEQRQNGWKSKNGLRPAEILLLYYCSIGQYPRPSKGYPGFWWFEYGIRNVSYILETLEKRGFIEYGSLPDSVTALTAAQLKQLLKDAGESTAGKKADLVERVKSAVPDDALKAIGLEPKYHLTQTGKAELSENSYVVNIHNSPDKTTSDSRYGPTYNLDAVASDLEKDPEISWEAAVSARKQKREDFLTDQKKQHNAFLEEMKSRNPAWYSKMKKLDASLAAQDRQLQKVQAAEAKYKESGDLEWYVDFWESLWANGGLLFRGFKWWFTLPDLYFKQKRYDDVIAFCEMAKARDNDVEEKADKYIQRAQERKAKQAEKQQKGKV